MADSEGLRSRKPADSDQSVPPKGRTRSISAAEIIDKSASQAAESFLTLPKLILHAILLVMTYAWWDTFGKWLVPVASYVAFLLIPVPFGRWSFEERMQVRSVVIIYVIMLSTPVLLVWILRRFGWFTRALLLAYVLWYTFCDDAPRCGGRFSPTLRRRSFWKHLASYFPMRLTRSVELDPSRNYIFGYHPHGIISLGAICNFATEATGFAELFPGIDLRVLTLAMNFRIPFSREYLLGMGINDASSESVRRNVTRGPGSSVMLVVGGARESLATQQGGRAGLVLENRKGFVKLAIKTGASLVPVFSFGENDLYGVYSNKKILQWQLRMQKKMGFALPFFFGRALTGGILHRVFGLNVGAMPMRVPVHSVVGNPIHTEKNDNPTQEQIDKVHAQYMEELIRVHDAWKDDYEKMRAEALKNCDQERLQVMQSKSFDKLSDNCLELSFVLD